MYFVRWFFNPLCIYIFTYGIPLLLILSLSVVEAYDRKIAITYIESWRGERSFANRLKKACETLHWQADLWEVEDQKQLFETAYDFVIHLVPHFSPHPSAKNYLALFDPCHHYFDAEGRLLDEYSDFDGYLLTYRRDQNDINFSSERSPPTMVWYPTVYKTPFKEVNPSTLFYMCAGWGRRSNDNRYIKFLRYISTMSYSRFYGPERFKDFFPKSYKGTIPFEDEYLLEKIAESGVYLLLHSETHLEYGIPSGRIFEAVAASALVISDNNRFVRENFGDSVLYIDVNATGKQIFRQINQHMAWISSHKREAKKMAQQSHNILTKKFLLEEQLLRLGDFHDRISSSYLRCNE